MTEQNFSKLLKILALYASFALEALLAQSPNYDEAADLSALTSLADERMHYLRISPPARSKSDLWEGIEISSVVLGQERYGELESLVKGKSASELQRIVSMGQSTYEEITRYFFSRIYRIESDDNLFLNSILSLNPNALSAAREADFKRISGESKDLNRFFGLPILLKDNIGFSGLPTTAGALALQNNFSDSAFVTSKLINSGVVILGKANLSEWAYFFCGDCPSGFSALGGQTLNPYGRLVFNTGGSSSGSGVAVAAGLAIAAVGSETSGSILSPSSANSLVGFKPTTGTLSRSGVVPISPTMDTVGPMATTVADVVALFNLMVGFDEADKAMPRLSAEMNLVNSSRTIEGYRLGLPEGIKLDPVIQPALAQLVKLGAELIPVEFDPPVSPEFVEFLGIEMIEGLTSYLREDAGPDVVVDGVRSLQAFNLQNLAERAPYGQALLDMMVSLSDEIQANADEAGGAIAIFRESLQLSAKTYLNSLFERYTLDALINLNSQGAQIAAVANYPALTMPVGYRENGKPVGLTFFAQSFREQRLVDIGISLETVSTARIFPKGY
ncbi:MAG: amidase [Deltaproteobacteria bacterium]|jgi:amidase|nr:amidase [Deltaproteobacteria bacterium]